MSYLTAPIAIDASVLAHVSPDTAACLLTGQRLSLPGPMVWHAWGPNEG